MMGRGNGTLMGLMLRGTTWYYRRSVAVELRPYFSGRRELWVSLRTSDREAAKLKALRVGHEVERQLQDARRRLASGDPTPPEQIAKEWQRRALAEDADWRATARPRTEEELDAELEALGNAIADHREALSEGDTGIVRTLLDDVLKEQGTVHVSPQHRQALALSLLRSRLDALEVAHKSATSAATGASVVDDSLTIRELMERWLAERQPHAKTKIEWLAALRRFEAVNGRSLLVKQVGKQHVRAFKASLLALPSKLSQAGTLSPKTVRKALGALSSVFRWGVGEGYLEASPFVGLTLVAKEKAASEDRGRLPYSTDDLKLIFGHALFSAPVLKPTPAPRRFAAPDGTLAARYWLPVLALYSAARLEELGGLRVQDVRSEDGIWFLNLTPHDARGLKTATSRRKVPLHPELQRLGFLDYVKACPAEGRVFPDLKPGKHGAFTGGFSQWWGRFSDGLELTDRRKTFHSLRHGAIDALRRAGAQDSLISAVVGHRVAGITARYGQGHSLPALAEAVASIRYEGVKLEDTGGGLRV